MKKNILYESTYGNVNLKNKNLKKHINDIKKRNIHNKSIEYKIFFILYLEEIENLINDKSLESFKKIEHFINENEKLNNICLNNICLNNIFYISVLNTKEDNMFIEEYCKKIIEIKNRYFNAYIESLKSFIIKYELKEEVINELKLNEVLNNSIKQKKVRI